MSSLEPLCNFRRNPCSLELTASVVSAAELCRQAAMMNPANPPEKVPEIIALPPAIEQKIERFMPMVKYEIESWINFYDREIFFDKVGSRAEEYFHVLVWSDDGTINEEETAREMLQQDDLNAEEKYRIACNHCLENEIPTLWSNLETKINLRKYDRRRYPFVYYWECVCRNGKTTGLTKYVLDNVYNTEHMYPVCAVDYFLNRSKLEKRINFTNTRYLQKMPFRSWENFLTKLTNEELVSLFYDDDENKKYVLLELDILGFLMRFWMHADFVVQIWMRIRDWYCEDTFAGLIGESFEYDMFDIHSTDHIFLTVEIFDLAPYKLRRVVFDDYIDEKWWDRDLNLTDVRLDVAILSTIDSNRRHRFWAENWIDVFKKYPTDCFLQLMDVCCAEEGTEEFKMQVMKMQDYWSSDHCYTLFRGMRFSELDHFLGIFSSDTDRIMKTKQMILRENFFERITWFETDRFVFPPPNQLVDFIEGSFENIRSDNEFKIEVLSSVNFLKACYKVSGNDIFSWLKDAVWMCSFNDDDFKRYKSMFVQLDVELAKSSEIPDVFNDPGWISLLRWCSNVC
ncbi:uncharacterized protein LOC135845894 isoform X3 [Planococcus citri]|uniref:uncharacterized protein LOC135845894 isoform X3 n=1 Tax=Planococcus citri TaxID=170843 RepID=UPI0031F95FEE